MQKVLLKKVIKIKIKIFNFTKNLIYFCIIGKQPENKKKKVDVQSNQDNTRKSGIIFIIYLIYFNYFYFINFIFILIIPI
jgi:hypothetical protein